jgi:hypothetical protein
MLHISCYRREFPKRKFFFMGAFDAVAGVLMLFGGVHTAGSTQALLNNAVIPVTSIDTHDTHTLGFIYYSSFIVIVIPLCWVFVYVMG